MSWRDFQYLSVYTAVPVSTNDGSWQKVAKERIYSHKFGYGKLDASRIVEAAKTWQNVKTAVHHTTPYITVDQVIPSNNEGMPAVYTFTKDMFVKADMKRLEHVTVSLNVDHSRRGDIEVQLVSPNGYVSQLSTSRANDFTKKGYNAWKFMTVKHW